MTPLNIDEILAALATHPELSPHLQAIQRIPSRPCSRTALPPGVPHAIAERLARWGVHELYDHQVAAVRAAESGDVVLATGTASGKTLGYLLPILTALEAEPAARALILYPTKALAQDQMGKIDDLTRGTEIRSALYDGDTPANRRSAIRKSAQIVLTNPDMLHLGILPQHEMWGHFLRSLRVIVIDEMHVYRGVFGGHLAWVLRRLLRLCEWYGSRPKILAASATLANPGEQFFQLTGRRAEEIRVDASRHGARAIALLAAEEDGAVSPNVLAASATTFLMQEGLRVMTFARSRGTVERLVMTLRRQAPDLAERVESYRGGYTAKERREIEQRLFRGDLQGIVTTNAMELGVDVGQLDAVVLNGLPSSRSSFWQQAGRAGRGGSPGLVLAVAHEDAWEQYMVRRPELLLESGVESTFVSPDNPYISASHLNCAAHERPLSRPEVARWGPEAQQVIAQMVAGGQLQDQADRYFFPSHTPPAAGVNLRGSRSEVITLTENGVALGTMERSRALREAFPGAIYLHRGQTYLVRSLALETGVASCERADVDYYTQALVQSVVEPEMELESYAWGSCRAALMALRVTTVVTGFARMSLNGQSVLDTEELDLPPQTFSTIGIRIDFPAVPMDEIENVAGAIHGVEHALLATAPALVNADRNDLGSAWYALVPETFAPGVYIFDAAEGGSGLASALATRLEEWATHATDLLRSCDCEFGCPRCLLSGRCESRNENLNKAETLSWLEELRTD